MMTDDLERGLITGLKYLKLGGQTFRVARQTGNMKIFVLLTLFGGIAMAI